MGRIVVVGAGVIGLMCAYELRRRGAEVVILDRAEAGSGCSWANMGWIVPSFSRPLPAPGLVRTSLKWMLDPASPLYIKPRLDLNLVRWLWTFWRHCNERDYQTGLRALAHLCAGTMGAFDTLRADGVEFEMHQSGVLLLFLSRAAQEEVLEDLEMMVTYGLPSPRRLGQEDVREIEPRVHAEVVGGLLVDRERHLRPETLIMGLVTRLTRMGVEIRQDVEVTGAHRHGSSVTTVVTAQGEVRGDQVLLAAGAWSGAIAKRMGFQLPIQAGKGYSITIANPSWQPIHALYLDEARVAYSSFLGALRVGGTMEFAGFNMAVDQQRIKGLRQATTRYLRDWPSGDHENSWAGMRPLTPDGLPLIGLAPNCDNLFVATGHGMLGLTLSPATGVAIAQLMRTGKSDFDLEAFRPDRFV